MFEDVDMDMDNLPGLRQGFFPQHESVDNVIAHLFALGPNFITSSGAVEQGQRIAESSVTTKGWHNVRLASVSLTRCRQYSYYLLPPAIPPEYSVSRRKLKEWGEAPTEDEIFVTADLDEFELSKNLQPSGPDNPIIGQFEESDSYAELYGTSPDTSSVLQVRPERRRDLDLSPLHDAIPEPHFFPPLASSDTQSRIAPYTKATPIPIPPHTLSSVHKRLNTPYSRGAWIIPIRGIPPWEGSSPANVVHLSMSSIYSPSRLVDIVWTRESLLSFWNFFVRTRHARTLGHISLSFQASSTSGAPTTTLQDHVVTDPPSGRFGSDGNKSIFSMDHFKIYCDVESAMCIRNVLDAWFLDWEPSLWTDKKQETKKERVRPLLGARIAFVDEIGDGVMIL